MKKILVVDDDKGILNALSFMLSHEGYNVITDLGETVIAKIKSDHPNIILLDVLLSGKDGREICKKIKSQEKLKLTPIILLSAHPDIKEKYKIYGADAFLAKPFDNEKLLALIRKHAI